MFRSLLTSFSVIPSSHDDHKHAFECILALFYNTKGVMIVVQQSLKVFKCCFWNLTLCLLIVDCNAGRDQRAIRLIDLYRLTCWLISAGVMVTELPGNQPRSNMLSLWTKRIIYVCNWLWPFTVCVDKVSVSLHAVTYRLHEGPCDLLGKLDTQRLCQRNVSAGNALREKIKFLLFMADKKGIVQLAFRGKVCSNVCYVWMDSLHCSL